MKEEFDSVAVLENIERVSQALRRRLAEVVVGQERVVEELLLGVITGGHVLLEGVPGLAKTMIVSLMADCAGLNYSRIQFTPDLMPGDILGSEVLEEDKATGSRAFRFIKGPVFTQVLLADEINRTPPKTQAALLQSMQEKKVAIGGQVHELPFPFLVYATQNPIENEGTYPLPEAQLDRFMFKVIIGYPSDAEERKIAMLSPREFQAPVGDNPISTPDYHAWYKALDSMPLADNVVDGAVRLVRQSRPDSPDADDFIHSQVRYGAGPRAAQYLVLAAKGLAALRGDSAPDLAHLHAVAAPVLRHRILPSFSAEASRVTSEEIIAHLLKKVLG